MFDKYWFYKTWNIDDNKIFQLDLWASYNLKIENNEYLIFHKRKFKKLNINNLQNWMWLVTQKQDIKFSFNKESFINWLCYYQRNLKTAFIKNWWLDELELYNNLFKNFWLELKYRKHLEIHWNYKNIEDIKQSFSTDNLDQAISFLLALAIIYWDWNIVEEWENIYLWSILIKFPFDNSLVEFQNIIFNLEDTLIKNKIYNKLTYTKKQEFIWNIQDIDLLEILWKSIMLKWIKDFFQTEEKLEPLFNTKFELLKKQLNNDLRINIDNFKITEIKWISLDF